MKKLKDSVSPRSGMALPAVVFVVLFTSAILAVAVTASLQRTHTTRKLGNRVRAEAIAETGIAEAYRLLADDFGSRTNAALFPIGTNYGGGSYEVSVDAVGGDVAVIRSVGRYNQEAVTVVMDTKNFGGARPSEAPPGTAWEKTLYANGQITVNGNGEIHGAAHANAQMRFNGTLDWGDQGVPRYLSSMTSIRVNGNVVTTCTLHAPTVEITGGNDSGATIVEQPYPLIEFPSMDLTRYYNTAVENGQVYPGGTYKNTYDWTAIPGGVLWFNGNLKLSGQAVVKGLIIATGYVWISGGVDMEKSEEGLAGIISRDSYVKLSGNHTGMGLIYCPGDVTLSGNENFEGQIISGEDITFNGNVGVIHYAYSPMPEQGTPEVTDTYVGVRAWQL